MKIFINKIPHQTQTQTLAELLAEVGKAQATGIAVAINQSVIPRSQWEIYTLSENDAITVITATQGG